jgi:predicted Zn-dependent protease
VKYCSVNADEILTWLLYKNKPYRSTIMLAICYFDAYSDGLNFVFGQAHVFGSRSRIHSATIAR